MKCCPLCFSDRFLKSQIQAMSNEKGKCSICNTENVTIINAECLTSYFEPLFDLYDKNSNGNYVNELLQDDWDIFAFKNKKKQLKLISVIAQNPEISNELYLPKYLKDKVNIEKWKKFSEELKFKNRFIPKEAPDKELFEESGKALGVSIKQAQKFYRARINSFGKKFKLKDLKKPPSNLASNGRANPKGISYLYVASTLETAIAEVRPHKGDIVTVLEFTVKKEMDFYDLRDPKSTISPFELSENIIFIYTQIPYLELLGSELSKPVTPGMADFEYLPTQYLCERIKLIGYQGIIYKSSLANGFNYVLFNDKNLSSAQINEYEIKDTNYSITKITL